MRMRSLLPLLLAALVAVVAFPDGADAVWTQISNPGKNALAIQVGKFSVILYSMRNANPRTRKPLPLQLVNVVRGETQPAGNGGLTDYRLVLNVNNTDTGSTALYQSVVRGKPGSNWVLNSFELYTQQP